MAAKHITTLLATDMLTEFSDSLKQHLFHHGKDAKIIDHLRIPAWDVLHHKMPNLGPDKQMKHVQGAILRAITLLTQHEGMTDFPQREHVVFPHPVELSGTPKSNMFAPEVGRRLPDYSRLDVMQASSDVPFAMNDYTTQAFELYLQSNLAVATEDAQRLTHRKALLYNEVCEWDEMYFLNRRQDSRGRKQVDSGEFRGKQGDKLDKLLTHSSIAKDTDPNCPRVHYFLKKGHGFDPLYFEDIREHIKAGRENAFDKWGTSFMDGYYKYLQIVETGKSTALNGCDMIASVILLITLLFGDMKAAKKLGLFEGGKPWLLKEKRDFWSGVIHSFKRKYRGTWGTGPMTPEMYKAIRDTIKGPGTGTSFGAGPETIAYMIAGLNISRDRERLDGDVTQQFSVEERIKFSDLLAPHTEGMSTAAKLEYATKIARILGPIFGREMPHVVKINGSMRAATRNRIMHGESIRDTPLCDLPDIVQPDGFRDKAALWRRNQFASDTIKAQVLGSAEECKVSRIRFDHQPNQLTRLIHGLEAYIDAELDREWLIKRKKNTSQSVFDCKYLHFVDIPEFFDFAPGILKRCVQEVIDQGNPLTQFAEMTNTRITPPQFTMADLPKDLLCYDA